MNDIQITSTTDSKEAVNLALGTKPETEPAKEDKSAAEITEENPAETLEASESQDAEKPEGEKPESEQVKPKKSNGYKKKIAKLTRGNYERDARIQAQEQELERWRKGELRASDAEKIATTSKKPDGKPRAEDFQTHAEYTEALTDWKVDQKIMARERESQKVEAESEASQLVSDHAKRVDEYRKTHGDFDELLESVDDVPLSKQFIDAVVESEMGPEIMEELARKPDELERIAQLDPRLLAKEIGKLEARLEAKKPAEEKLETKLTKAPKPITPVGSKASTTKSPEEMTYEEFYEWEEARLKKRRA